MAYIDFHCHPALKTFLGANKEEDRESCWENVSVRGHVELVDKFIKSILNSQSSLSQISKGDIHLAVVGLYPLERPVITGMIKRINQVFVDLLTISNFVNKVDYKLLSSIAFHQKGYFEYLIELQEHLLKSQTINKGFKVLQRAKEIDSDKLNVILTIEGGHSLFNEIEHYSESEVLSNLKELKNNDIHYLYFTLAHLIRNPLCNHAYGIHDIEHERFIPIGNGISKLGYKVINEVLDNSKGQRILIDVKHMSLKSRLQYYELRDKKFPDIPIIASHVGVTGVSMMNKPVNFVKEHDGYYEVRYKKPVGLKRTRFNPGSINLYNEEIERIVNSDGMIGITFDEKILGNKKHYKKSRSEYISKLEFNDYNIEPDNKTYNENVIIRFKDFIIRIFTFNRDIKSLCNNILHIIRVSGEKGWDHVCIGSDFDGLIHAIKACKNAKKMKKLEKKLIKFLYKLAQSDPETDYYIDNIEDRVKALLFQNAKRFINTYFV